MRTIFDDEFVLTNNMEHYLNNLSRAVSLMNSDSTRNRPIEILTFATHDKTHTVIPEDDGIYDKDYSGDYIKDVIEGTITPEHMIHSEVLDTSARLVYTSKCNNIDGVYIDLKQIQYSR